MKYDDKYFEDVEKKTSVSKDQIMRLAQSIQSENLKDERVLRELIQNVGYLAGKKIDKTQEEKILKAVMNENFKS